MISRIEAGIAAGDRQALLLKLSTARAELRWTKDNEGRLTRQLE